MKRLFIFNRYLLRILGKKKKHFVAPVLRNYWDISYELNQDREFVPGSASICIMNNGKMLGFNSQGVPNIWAYKNQDHVHFLHLRIPNVNL